MPTIIIKTDGNSHPAAITLAERIVPADAHSDHYLAQLGNAWTGHSWTPRSWRGVTRAPAAAHAESWCTA